MTTEKPKKIDAEVAIFKVYEKALAEKDITIKNYQNTIKEKDNEITKLKSALDIEKAWSEMQKAVNEKLKSEKADLIKAVTVLVEKQTKAVLECKDLQYSRALSYRDGMEFVEEKVLELLKGGKG